MPDLAVHLCAAIVAGKAIRNPSARVLFYVGNCLPDFADKALKLGAASPFTFTEVTHAPYGILCLSYALALSFEAAWRARAFWLLLAGSLLHIGMDAMKSNLCHGTVIWAFPFRLDRHEFGWYSPETSTTSLLPWFLAAALLAEGLERLIAGRGRSSPAPGG